MSVRGRNDVVIVVDELGSPNPFSQVGAPRIVRKIDNATHAETRLSPASPSAWERDIPRMGKEYKQGLRVRRL